MLKKEKFESILEELSTLYNETYIPLIHQYGIIDLVKFRGFDITVRTYNPDYTNIRILSELLNRELQIIDNYCFCTAKGIDWQMLNKPDLHNKYTEQLDEYAVSQIIKICDSINNFKLGIVFSERGINIHIPMDSNKLYKLLDSIDNIKTIKECLISGDVVFKFYYKDIDICITK